MLAFAVCWALLCRWTPGPLYRWRLLVLRLFGCRVSGTPRISANCRIWIPWRLELEDEACIGREVEVYNLGGCILRKRCTVAQQTYLCGGSHDLSSRAMRLTVAPIEVGADAFIGARVFVMPGVVVGEGAVVAAASVLARDEFVDYWMGHGALLLGHANPPVVEAVRANALRLTHAGGCHPLEHDWAQIV
ncbi:MAG: DapH/DapD/GlmU-related protein, partial [Phycisphaerales bacterium]